ncbi:MFS transporter [Saccharothrix coeruleofusca]|uniref:MFS family arabinose efflux permease n=1 Tax=Saccharothrix coeruleofusca TaxID=33919 RepID=A0A918APW5_9PSEU|nr:MFS transporter [Saccharothrix coeruleofusca]GGP67224.1 hypothetical protein GCM10010185_45110 [Saccharothrix coeruleofusca]
MRLYLCAAALARTADEMVGVALVLLVLERTGDAALSGAVVAAYTVPSVLSGPLLGAWLDRARRPVIALAGNQFLLAAVALGLVLAGDRLAVLLGLAFLGGTTLPMTSGGFSSLVPRLGRDDLPRATAADALVFNAAAIGGPALAGVLSAVWGPAVAVLGISGLSLLGGLCTTALRVPPHEAARRAPLLAAMRAGLRHLATTAPLRGATAATVLSYGTVGLLSTGLPAHLASLDLDEDLVGVVWAVFEAGAITGVFALRRHLPRWRPERVIFTLLPLYGLAVAVWPLPSGLGVLLALVFVGGAVDGPVLTATMTARQRYTPEELLGQVSTTGASLKIGGYAVGAATGGWLVAGGLAPALVILLVAAGQVAAAGLGALTARSRHPVRVSP